ncbi:hypothetical protein F4775DRAFT_599602 [Biscogniauxia sp. FL1348]|nr:hypothetical protein F4775DRAFT_599602 [Biscogniauxia sp. FL1348]
MDAQTISTYTTEPQVFVKEVNIVKTTEYVMSTANAFAGGEPSPSTPQPELTQFLWDTWMNATSGIKEAIGALLALLFWCRRHIASGAKALCVVPFLLFPAAALVAVGVYLLYVGRPRAKGQPVLGPPVGKTISAPAGGSTKPFTIASLGVSSAAPDNNDAFDMSALSAAVPTPPPAQTTSLPAASLPLPSSWDKKTKYYGPLMYPTVRTACKTDAEARKATDLLLQRSEAELRHFLNNPHELQLQVASAAVAVGMGALSI